MLPGKLGDNYPSSPRVLNGKPDRGTVTVGTQISHSGVWESWESTEIALQRSPSFPGNSHIETADVEALSFLDLISEMNPEQMENK